MSSPTSLPIAAIATAPGRGGIGIVRLSGTPLAVTVQTLFGRALTPRHAHFLPFTAADGEVLDEGIALFFPGPNSYTGEDVLELQGHGGPAVLQRVLQRCLEAGQPQRLRLAEPGEFTRRAFLNGRLDLAQAEAVADLIDAASTAAARSAAQSLRGAFSQEVNQLAERILELRLLVEATLDFPEEEIEFLEKYQAAQRLAVLQGELNAVIARARQGALLRSGLRVVLAGAPNVGKSSLLNALAGFEAAIVTPIAGTTRDKVEQQITLEGIPLHIVDTAGLRDTDDEVERIGIARTREELARADLVLALDVAAPVAAADGSALVSAPGDVSLDPALQASLPPGIPVLVVLNKADLAPEHQAPDGALLISARTGQGLDALRQRLLEHAGWSSTMESPFLARERHLHALDTARLALEQAAGHAAQDDRVLDLFAEELRLAHDALGEITGAVSSDDLLGAIFSRFCIGK